MESTKFILFVKRLQRNAVINWFATGIMLQHNHTGPQRPLLGQIDPRAQSIPTEIDLEGFQQTNCNGISNNDVNQSFPVLNQRQSLTRNVYDIH